MGIGDTKTRLASSPAVLAKGQCRLTQASHWQPLLLATLFFILLAPGAMAAQQTEDLDSTIRYLITYVKESDVTFERNTTRYTGDEAAQHINRKYQHFKDDIDSPEKFIELCATGSLMTGKPYLLITEQGEQLPLSEWLNTVLADYRFRNEDTGP